MPYINCKNTNEKIRLYYEDLGDEQPVVFIHGWPVSHAMWEYQITPLREAGLRCIAYDRRGFGKSDQSLDSYDYDALAGDLKCLLDELDLKDVTLVGFSMGGGEVVRYCSKYNCARVSKIVLVSSIIPYMLKTNDNPDGVSLEMFKDFENNIRENRHAFLQTFFKHFFGANLIKHPVSQATLDYSFSLAASASQKATIDCMTSFSQTDFRKELASVTVPALVIHGDADKTVPINATSDQAAKFLPDAKYKVYPGAPHGLFITDKVTLTNDILSFVKNGTVVSVSDLYNVDEDELKPVLPAN